MLGPRCLNPIAIGAWSTLFHVSIASKLIFSVQCIYHHLETSAASFHTLMPLLTLFRSGATQFRTASPFPHYPSSGHSHVLHLSNTAIGLESSEGLENLDFSLEAADLSSASRIDTTVVYEAALGFRVQEETEGASGFHCEFVHIDGQKMR